MLRPLGLPQLEDLETIGRRGGKRESKHQNQVSAGPGKRDIDLLRNWWQERVWFSWLRKERGIQVTIKCGRFQDVIHNKVRNCCAVTPTSDHKVATES